MASSAVEVAPRMGTAWVALGQALKACDRIHEAETAYAGALPTRWNERACPAGSGRAQNQRGASGRSHF
jgi:hypothetical protein